MTSDTEHPESQSVGVGDASTAIRAVGVRRFEGVRIGGIAARLPPEVVTTAELEATLAPVYDRLRLPAGRLELMTGIAERRFFPAGTRPGDVSPRTVEDALQAADVDPSEVDLLIHASVCRDQMEPATAAGVHARCGLPPSCRFFDLSNACLGIVDGISLLAELVTSGAVRTGVVVGTEIGRPLVEGTVSDLLAKPDTDRKSMKDAFASLTIGSGSAAVVVGSSSRFEGGTSVDGVAVATDTDASRLCEGGGDLAADGRPRMSTDSEALLHAGVALTGRTYDALRRDVLGGEAPPRVVTHQVGSRHRSMLLKSLGLPGTSDFPVVERTGNTGSCALPTAAVLAARAGHLEGGQRAAMLGIGSGLSCLMMAVTWGRTNVSLVDEAVG